MNNHDVFELYTDYLLTSFSYTTATGLSDLLDGQVSHNQVTRFLASEDFDSKKLLIAVVGPCKGAANGLLDKFDGILMNDQQNSANFY